MEDHGSYSPEGVRYKLQGAIIAILYVHVRVLKLFVDVPDSQLFQPARKNARTHVETELVLRPTVHEDFQLTKSRFMPLDHAHGIPCKPTLPDILAELARLRIKRQIEQVRLGLWIGRITG